MKSQLRCYPLTGSTMGEVLHQRRGREYCLDDITDISLPCERDVLTTFIGDSSRKSPKPIKNLFYGFYGPQGNPARIVAMVGC